MKKYWIILVVVLLITIVIFVPSISSKKSECGYWDEIGLKKECACTGELTTSGDIGAKTYCSGTCDLNDCKCRAPIRNETSKEIIGLKEIDCNELDRLISEGYYGEGVKNYID